MQEYNKKELDKEIDSTEESFVKPFHIAVTIFALVYLYSLFLGDYSIGVLLDVNKRLKALKSEYIQLQNENQKLQKKHFELIQLTPQEDAF